MNETKPPIMTINDELLAELEGDAKARMAIKLGHCEGGIRLNGRDCHKCGNGPQDGCGRPLPERYSNPSTILALLQHVRELKADAERLDWVLDHAEVRNHGISLPCGPSRKLDKESSKAAIDAARSSADKGADK